MATGNAINANTAGLVRSNGTGTFDAVTTTNHDILIGAASNGITNVAPSATSGVPLISQGASADPTFGTAVVAGGGTGRTTLTNHGVLVGAGTSAITQLSVGGNNTVLQGTASSDPSFTATPQLTGLGIGAASTGSGLTFDGTSALSTYIQAQTFSPAFAGSSVAGTFTYTAQNGRWMRIGKMVYVAINAAWGSSGGASGTLQCTNLPYASVNYASMQPCLNTWMSFSNTNAPGAGLIPVLYISSNTTTLNIATYNQTTGGVGGYAAGDSQGISCSFWYETN